MRASGSGRHPVSRLTVHVVWATKERDHVLVGEVNPQCRELLIHIGDAEEVRMLKGVVSRDHWAGPKVWTIASRDSAQEIGYRIVCQCSPRCRDDGRLCGALSAEGDGSLAPGQLGKFVGCTVFQGGMGPTGVVKRPVPVQQHLGVPGRIQYVLVETLLSQPSVETLGKAVLPGFPWLNEPRADVLDRQPDSQVTGDEL